MMWRMVRALEVRAIRNPAMLPQVVRLAERLAEVVNVAVASNASRYAVDPRTGASMAECGRALGITKQSASQRRALGDAVIDARVEAAGAARFSEAARERAAVDQVDQTAVITLADYLARRAS